MLFHAASMFWDVFGGFISSSLVHLRLYVYAYVPDTLAKLNAPLCNALLCDCRLVCEIPVRPWGSSCVFGLRSLQHLSKVVLMRSCAFDARPFS